jgi:hypothetical protein
MVSNHNIAGDGERRRETRLTGRILLWCAQGEGGLLGARTHRARVAIDGAVRPEEAATSGGVFESTALARRSRNHLLRTAIDTTESDRGDDSD